jgi:hypothetical protein
VGYLGQRCWLRMPPLASVVALLGPLASMRQQQRRGIRWMCVCGLFGVYEWLGWLLRRWWGLDLRSARTCPRPEAPSQISFCVIFHGCFIEFANTVGANVEIC